ncbi:MAG: hypothetical protein WCV80_03715, partial [Candidatus Paceibacterota bacterium]
MKETKRSLSSLVERISAQEEFWRKLLKKDIDVRSGLHYPRIFNNPKPEEISVILIIPRVDSLLQILLQKCEEVVGVNSYLEARDITELTHTEGPTTNYILWHSGLEKPDYFSISASDSRYMATKTPGRRTMNLTERLAFGLQFFDEHEAWPDTNTETLCAPSE